jgi:hypothetical protein
MDDRSVTQRPRVAVPLAACSGPAALAGMEALETIDDALQRSHLRRRERARFKRRQRQRPHATRRIPARQRIRCAHRDPAAEPRQRRKMIVDRRRPEPRGDERVAPANDVAAHHARQALMTIGHRQVLAEATKMQRDPLRDLARTHSGQRQLLVAGSPSRHRGRLS